MKPGEPIYDAFSERMQESAPDILRYADAAETINKIVNWATEDCKTLAFPRVSQVRQAVQRELNEYGVVFARGTVYQTPAYDGFDASREGDAPSMQFESMIAVVTRENSDGKFANFLDRLDGISKDSGAVALIHMTKPITSPAVAGIESINFVVVKPKSNESFWFTLEPNDNKGKVLATEAMQNEFGVVRERFGPIDKLPIKAVPATLEMRDLMLSELNNAAKQLVKEKVPTPTRSQRIKEKAGGVGKLMVSRYRSVTAKT